MLEHVTVPLTFTTDSLRRFEAELRALAEPGRCRAVILVGGPAQFSLGLDLASAMGGNRLALIDAARACFHCLRGYPLPLVAELEGEAIAGGVIWLGLADVVVAAETARIQLPEASFGLAPWFVMACLRERLSARAVTRLAASCESLDAAAAQAIGLVDHVHPVADLATASRSRARALARPGPEVFRQIKDFAASTRPLAERLDAAALALASAMETDETRARMEAYRDALALMSGPENDERDEHDETEEDTLRHA